MPTITIGTGKTYSSPIAAWNALSGSDQGGDVIAEMDAEDYPAFNPTTNSVNKWTFKDAVTTYDFTASTEDLLARIDRVIIGSAVSNDLTMQDLSIYSSNVFQSPFTCSANNNQFNRLIIQQAATNNSTVLNSASITATNYDHCVILGGSDAAISGFNQGATKTNCIIAGANDKGVEASAGTGVNIVDKCFVFNNGGLDLDTGQLTITETATEDGTGTYTGYTSSECVDFANRNYLLKASSALATIASGGPVGVGVEASTGVTLIVDSGLYAQSGSNLNLQAQLIITTTSNSYLLAGSLVNLQAAKKLIVNAGAYDLTGTDVTLTYTPGGGGDEVIIIDSGLYSLAGNEVLLKADLSITSNSGNYSLIGTVTAIKYNALVTLDSGDYSLAGTQLNTFANYGMIAVSNSYTLTGVSVTLRYSGDTNQVIGTVTAGFTADLYSASYKPTTITVTFKD